MKSILIKTLYILIIVLLLYDVSLIIQTIINPNTIPEIFGIKIFNIISSSMQPEIDVNDIVFIKRVNQNELQKNDIVTFKVDDELITHRIINIQYGDKIVYTTKGDNNKLSDTRKIEFSQIEGKYIFKIAKAGKLLKFLKNKIVFGIIMIFTMVKFILNRIRINNRIRRKEKRIQYEKEKDNEII